MKRIVVIGTSCSGKSTLADKLSQLQGSKCIDLDDLHWLPDWQERDDAEFAQLVEQETAGNHWVVAGNYSVVRELLWSRADTIIWLKLPFLAVLYSVIIRCLVRAYTKQQLFAGNFESFRQSFFSKDSVILWVIQTHKKHSQQYSRLLHEPLAKHAKVIVLESRKAIDEFSDSI